MNFKDTIKKYQDEGLSKELASARICQDVVLKAIADGPLRRNVTIKGGIVMKSITCDNRRSTRDIDLDLIHYSLSNDSLKEFVNKLNCIYGVKIIIIGEIVELKHQDYHGKRMSVKITDEYGYDITSKIDIGIHKHFEIEQDEYCFDVFMSDEGACLFKNTVEQIFVEKLRSLLIFGPNSYRYKDIYDLYYLKDVVDKNKFHSAMQTLIFYDSSIRENGYADVIKRVVNTFNEQEYLTRVSKSYQRWIDEDIDTIIGGIIKFLREMELK